MTLIVRATGRGAGTGARRARVRTGHAAPRPRPGRSGGRVHPRHRRGRQVRPGRGVRRRSTGRRAPSSCASTAAPSSPRRAGSSPRCRAPPAASSTPRKTPPPGSPGSARASSSSLDRYEVLRPVDPWLQQAFVPALPRQRADRPRGPRATDDGLADRPGPPVPQPPARATCRADDAEALLRRGRRHGRRRRADLPARPGPSAVAPDSRRPRSPTRPAATMTRPRSRRSWTSSPSSTSPGSTRRRARRSTPRRSCAGRRSRCSRRCSPTPRRRTRSTACGACRSSSSSDDGLVLHDTVREAVAAHLRSVRPRPVAALPRRRLATAPRRGRARRRPQEMWRYTADLLLHPPEPDRPRGVLPDDRAPLLRRACTARGLAGDRGSLGAAQPAERRSRSCRDWWQRDPDAFRVARDRRGDRRRLLRARRAGPREPRRCWTSTRSPGAGATTCASHPVPRGQRVLFDPLRARRATIGEASSPCRPRSARPQAPVPGAPARAASDLHRRARDVRRARRGTRLGFVALPGEPVRIDGVAVPPVAARLRAVVDRRLAVAAHRRRSCRSRRTRSSTWRSTSSSSTAGGSTSRSSSSR